MAAESRKRRGHGGDQRDGYWGCVDQGVTRTGKRYWRRIQGGDQGKTTMADKGDIIVGTYEQSRRGVMEGRQGHGDGDGRHHKDKSKRAGFR